MRNLLCVLAVLAITTAFINCAPKTTGSLAATPEPSFTDAQKQEGMGIWQASCQKCHKLYEPTSHSIKQWERIIPRMAKKAKLDGEKQALVRAYILSHAKG